jgi:hypothetical protein
MTKFTGLPSLVVAFAATHAAAAGASLPPSGQNLQVQPGNAYVQNGQSQSISQTQSYGQSQMMGQTVTITCLGTQPGGPMTCTQQDGGSQIDVRRLVGAGILPPPPNDAASMPIGCCQAPYVQLSTGFFMGAISNGVGFNTETGYSYGGSGFGYVSGGTRFSGVRERSPTPLIPPGRKHRPPPPKPCGCH